MSEELANVDAMAIKMDRDPLASYTIEQEIAFAHSRMKRMHNDTRSLAYWTGMFDGLHTAFEIMKPKDG